MKKQNLHKVHLFIICILVCQLFYIAGCAYFNVFYNARKSYSAGVKVIERSSSNKPTNEAVGHFNVAIQKASKILSLYPGSRWNDDALLLIGKSYYYMQRYPQSKKSLQELIDNFPLSSLIPEARSYYAKSLLQEKQFELAEAEFQKIIASDANDKLKSEAFFGLSDLLYFKGDYEHAIEQHRNILQTVKNKSIRAQAQLKIADSYREMNDNENAAKEYLKVKEYDPPDNIAYLAEFGYGLALENSGNTDEAINVFTKLLGNRTYIDNYNDLFLEIARCHELNENVDEAIKVLQKLNSTDFEALKNAGDIPDLLMMGNQLNTARREAEGRSDQDENRRGENRGEVISETGKVTTDEDTRNETQAQKYVGNPEALFYIGELHLRKNFDYNTANKYYLEAKKAKPPSDLLKEINERTILLGEIRAIQRSLKINPPLQPVMKSIEKDTTEKQEEKKQPERTRLVSRRAINSAGGNRARQNTNVYEDSLKYMEALGKYEKSFLEYSNNQSEKLYRMAELFLQHIGNIDSAIAQLDRIISGISDNNKKPQGLFLKYNIAITNNLMDHDQIKNELLSEYPYSIYAAFITGNTDSIKVESSMLAEESDIDSSQILFFKAETAFQKDTDYLGVIEQYLDIVDKYPDTDLASKSLFAVGWILENKLNNNNLAIEAFLRIEKDYPESEYSLLLKSGLKEVKKMRDEQERQKKLNEKRSEVLDIQPDSISAVYRDSLKSIISDSAVITHETFLKDSLLQLNQEDEDIIEMDSLSLNEGQSDSTGHVFDNAILNIVEVPEELVRRIKGIVLTETTKIISTDSAKTVSIDSSLSSISDSTQISSADTINTPEPGKIEPDRQVEKNNDIEQPQNEQVMIDTITNRNIQVKPDTVQTSKIDSTGVSAQDTIRSSLPDTVKIRKSTLNHSKKY